MRLSFRQLCQVERLVMNKLTQADFDKATSVIEKPKEKTEAEKLQEFRDANKAEYKEACDRYECTCTPTRADMLLMDKYQGHRPL